MRLWRVQDGYLLRQFRRHVGEDDLRVVTVVAFSPDGQILASAGEEGNLFLWSVSTGSCLHSLMEHEGPVESLAWHPEGQLLVSGGQDGTLQLWDIHTGSALARLDVHDGGARRVAWSPSGQMLVSLGMLDRTVHVWRAQRRSVR